MKTKPAEGRYKDLYWPSNYEPYAWLQALDVFPFIDFEPRWLVDCGPGLGQEAWRFKERWPSINIVGLEPCVEVYEQMKSDYPGLLLPMAASDSTGKVKFSTGRGVNGNSLMVEADDAVAEVDSIRLDDLSLRVGGVHDAVLWADVEMSEELVIVGGVSLLTSGKIRLMNLEVRVDNEGDLDWLCEINGFYKVHSYAYNNYHHDNVYRRRS